MLLPVNPFSSLERRIMPRFKATIDLYLDVGDRWSDDFDGALADGIGGMLETIQQASHEANDEFILSDWSYIFVDNVYKYAEPYEGPTPNEEARSCLE